jgi:hypothetical protein
MTELQISANGEALTINGQSWSEAPLTNQLCKAIGAHDLIEGGSVVVDGKPTAKFKYLEQLGIAILESIPDCRVWRVAVYMQTPTRKRKTLSPYKLYGSVSQRPTEKAFAGVLELNGKQLRSPLRFAQFPITGELLFEHQIAVGRKLSASVAVESGFVKYVSFEFKRRYE